MKFQVFSQENNLIYFQGVNIAEGPENYSFGDETSVAPGSDTDSDGRDSAGKLSTLEAR